MSLNGRIIKTATGFAFESTSFDYNKPQSITHVWPLECCVVRGMCWKSETDSIGREARCTDGNVSCYLGDGVYFHGTMPQGGSTPALEIRIEPIAKPKRVRGETRWHYGRWEKYSTRQGWIAA